MKNEYFNSEDEAFSVALIGLSKFQFLSKIINTEKLEEAWHSKVIKNGLNKYFNPNYPFTIFTLCALAGKVKLNNGDFMYYDELLTRIDISLKKLYKSEGINNFSQKLRNPEGLQFHSTCSELFLAEYFIEKGYTITFEIPFIIVDLNGLSHNRNIDLLITNENGSQLFEVYNPIDSIQESGFLNISPELFLQAVQNKINKKFMPLKVKEYKDISSDIIFAINIHFCDTLITALNTPFNKYPSELIIRLESIRNYSKIIKKILLFENNSFKPLKPIKIYSYI